MFCNFNMQHCYCQSKGVNGIPHKVCCKCGDQQASTIAPIMLPSIYREMQLPYYPFTQVVD